MPRARAAARQTQTRSRAEPEPSCASPPAHSRRRDGGALRVADARRLQSARDASPRAAGSSSWCAEPCCGQASRTDGAFVPNLKQGLLTRGALDKAAGAILGNWKNGIGATAGLPSSSKSMRSDDAAVCSHGGSSSASSRDAQLRFRWGDDVLLLDDVSGHFRYRWPRISRRRRTGPLASPPATRRVAIA